MLLRLFLPLKDIADHLASDIPKICRKQEHVSKLLQPSQENSNKEVIHSRSRRYLKFHLLRRRPNSVSSELERPKSGVSWVADKQCPATTPKSYHPHILNSQKHLATNRERNDISEIMNPITEASTDQLGRARRSSDSIVILLFSNQ